MDPRDFIEAAPDPVVVVESDGQVVIRCDAAAARDLALAWSHWFEHELRSIRRPGWEATVFDLLSAAARADLANGVDPQVAFPPDAVRLVDVDQLLREAGA